MAITPAVELADFASGIGTAPLQIDNVNDRVGVGTTAPLALLDVASFERTGITTAVLIRHTGSSHHALRVEDEDHPDSTPFLINSNGRVAIGTDATDGFELTVAKVNPSIRLKATASGNSGRLLFSGRDSVGTAYTTEINSRNHGGLDIHLDFHGVNTDSDDISYRKLKLYPVGSAEDNSNSEPGVVVAFGGTFRNGPDQVGISSVGIGTVTPLGRFHIDLRQGDNDEKTFRIRNTTDNGASVLKLENLYDRDIGLALRTTETDGDIDSMETRWVVFNDGALGDERQNSFKINMVGAGFTNVFNINTNRRIGFGTDTPEHPLHIFRNDAILACFERQGMANAGIEFKKSNTGGAARSSMFLGLSDADTFAINDAEDLNSSPFFEINRTGIASAAAFTATNDTSNATDGTCAINLTGQTGCIAMDTDTSFVGTKRISWNDGTGNFNLRLNCTGAEEYLITNDGAAAIHLNGESTNGNVTIAAANQGTSGDAITFTEFVFDPDGKIAVQGNLTLAAEGTSRDLKLDAGDHIFLEAGESEDGAIYFRGNSGADSYRFSKSGQEDIEGFLSFESLTVDRTFTFPDATGTVMVAGVAEGNTSSYFEFVNGSGAEFRGKRNDSSVVDNNLIVGMRGFSNEGGTYHDVGRVQLQANGTHSSTSKPTSLNFFNCPSGSTTDREVMEIQQDGDCVLKPPGYSTGGATEISRAFKVSGASRVAELGLHQTTNSHPLAYLGLECQDGSNQKLWVDNGNKLRIGTALPETSGTTGTGTVVGTQTSDERLKHNIVDLPYGLAEIKQLRPRRFEMIDADDTQVYCGFIAQETQGIIPESVYDTEQDAEDGTDNTLLAMTYTELIAPLVNAVKELSTKNDELEARIATLEGS